MAFALSIDSFEMMSGHTPGEDSSFKHVWLVMDVPEIWIRIQACSNARIALSAKPHVTDVNTYEIIINNTDSEIRRWV